MVIVDNTAAKHDSDQSLFGQWITNAKPIRIITVTEIYIQF